jgi:hypothetical protein
MQTMRVTVWPAMCPQNRCVVILSNDVRSEAGFADLVGFILGDTGAVRLGYTDTSPASREFCKIVLQI